MIRYLFGCVILFPFRGWQSYGFPASFLEAELHGSITFIVRGKEEVVGLSVDGDLHQRCIGRQGAQVLGKQHQLIYGKAFIDGDSQRLCLCGELYMCYHQLIVQVQTDGIPVDLAIVEQVYPDGIGSHGRDMSRQNGRPA